MQKPFIIGHRGCAYEPENTLSSIKRAIELGVDGVEIDVRRCKSSEIVVIHDDKVDRTANGRGYVKDFNLKDLKKLNVNGTEKIPTLEEIIDFIRNFNYKNKKSIKLVVELKEKGLEEDVIKTIKKYSMVGNTIIISFYHQLIKNIKKLNSKINAGILFVGNPVDAVSLAKDADAELLFPNFNFVDRGFAENARKNKLKVFVWNIDDVENLKKMLELNVDGVGSNRPDVLINFLSKKSPNRNIY